MSGTVIPRIPVNISEDNLVEDSLKVISEIRPNWIEERDKNGTEIKSKVRVFEENILLN